ncbi:alpha/beta-hydrolase [Auricularia subglabra TFB-10046 SS5]|nr:alpha/beta-hydrolase [Auricularia subglabra TFB-10046 SS5]
MSFNIAALPALVAVALAGPIQSPLTATPRCVDSIAQITASAMNYDLSSGSVPENATVPVSGTFGIQLRFCEPTVTVASRADTLQVLVPGITYNTQYWDSGFEPEYYSYARFAAAQGYATLNMARLGYGQSDHPDPVAIAQTPLGVAILQEIVKAARGGSLPGAARGFETVLGIAHSYGSVLLNGLIIGAPDLIDAAVFTGYSHDLSKLAEVAAIAGLGPARDLAPARFGDLPEGYLTTANASSRALGLYGPAAPYDGAMLAFDEAHKDTTTTGEFLTIAAPVAAAPEFRGDVLTVNGAADHIFCAKPGCEDLADEARFYPAARSVEFVGVGTSESLGVGAGRDGLWRVTCFRCFPMLSANLRIPFVHLIRRLLNTLLYASPSARRSQLGVAFGTGAHSLDSADAPTTPDAPTPDAPVRPATPAAVEPLRRDDKDPESSIGDVVGGGGGEEHPPYGWPIHELMRNPTLYAPVRAPRHPVVLCHGLYGFDVRGPSSFPRLQMHYWSNVLDVLRKTVGANVLVAAVPSTGSVKTRAEAMDAFLRQRAQGRAVNFMAHSMGGLDCRHLITHIRPSEYTPVSLTTISTPHQGSPFMDWCLANIGIGASRVPHQPFPRPTSLPYSLKNPLLERVKEAKETKPVDLLSAATLASLPSSFTTVLLGLIDSPAYSNLTTYFLKNQFNPSTPDLKDVKYFSVAGRITSVSILHPLWLPKLILDAACAPSEGGNDGLVSVRSARWGTFLGVLEECDHWDMRGARGLSGSVEGLLDVFKPKRQEFGEKRSDAATAATEGETQRRVRDALHDSAEAQRHDRRREADAEVRNSTDRLSSVFDWIADHVPIGGDKEKEKEREKGKPKPPKEEKRKSDLASRADLERLYIALCRKLYDEGL